MAEPEPQRAGIILQCYRVCVGATLGANSRAGAPVSRDIVDIFILLFFSCRSLLSNNKSTQRCYHTTLVRSHFHLFLVFPLCLQLFYYITITGNPKVAATIQIHRHSAYVYKIALLLVEEGIRPSIHSSTDRPTSNLVGFLSLLCVRSCSDPFV